MCSVEKYINKVKKKLSSSDIEEKKILKYIRHLDKLEVNFEVLKNTGIGKFVNQLKKHEGEVGDAASSLVLKWKTLLTKQQDDTTSLQATATSQSLLEQTNTTKASLLNSEVKDSMSNRSERTNKREREDNDKHNYKDISKKDEPKTKNKGPGLQLCDISFGCEITSKDINRQKKKQKLNTSSTPSSKLSSSSSSLSSLSSPSSSRVNHSSHNSRSTSSYLPPLPSVASVNEALLPDIQPTYKPNRMPMFDDSPSKKKRGADIDIGGEIKSKKSKTQVFSGRKHATYGVPSLFDLCIRVLIDNIDALHETGGVPYYILHAVLVKCTPQQLLHLEECNPEILEESDELWQVHYKREFKTERQISGLSWRECYLEKCEEREERLKKINAKISASQAAKKPERQAMLAYVETVAKPPPQIRRKQARFGTAHAAGIGEAPSNAISPIKHKTHHKTSHSSSHSFSHSSISNHTSLAPAPPSIAPPRRPVAASAPLLKKTMKMFKNQRSINGSQIRRK